VLSPNTQRHERGDKRLAYQTIPSLLEYVLVAQDRPLIEVSGRTASGWDTRRYETPDARLELDSIGLALPMAEIYA
jgi:Uma2 family endonuclease